MLSEPSKDATDESSSEFFTRIYYKKIKKHRRMQLVTEINGQAVCEKVLAADSRVMYSGYFTSDGTRVGEAMRSYIVDYEKLTVMVLPHHPSTDVMVLAASPSFDLKEIISRAKEANGLILGLDKILGGKLK
jgi:hypothetical protein